MTVENSSRIRLQCLQIGFKMSRQFYNTWEAKPKPKPKPIAPCTRVFPLRKLHETATGILIGSSSCLLLLWLVGIVPLVLVYRHSFENCSMYQRYSFSTHWYRLRIASTKSDTNCPLRACGHCSDYMAKKKSTNVSVYIVQNPEKGRDHVKGSWLRF